jgi:hypothetical protein
MLNKVEHIKDPLKKIEKLLRIAVEFHDEKSFMVKALRDSHAQYPPYLKEKYRLQMETQVLNIFTNILKEGTKKGEFRDLDFLAVSYFMFKLFQSITYARTASIKNGRKLLDEFINFILKGIQKR